MNEMYYKLCARFMLKPYECNELKQYIEDYYSLDDTFEKIHPLCGVVDRSLRTAHGCSWKKMIGGEDSLLEFSGKYYQRIYEHLDILNNDEIYTLCRYPHEKENTVGMIQVFEILKLYKKIGYHIGNGNTLHLLNIDDIYTESINRHYMNKLGGEYFA